MRIKRGNVCRNRHKKILKLAKGFKGARSRIFKVANIAVMKALNACKKANIQVNRKMLADLAVNDKDAFAVVVEAAKAAL